MSQRAKLIKRMREHPATIRFEEVEALASYLGMEQRATGADNYFWHDRAHPGAIMVAKPHNGRATVRPSYIRSFVRELERAGLIPLDGADNDADDAEGEDG